MGFGDNLGGLGEHAENLKNEHGDKINDGVDSLQEQHGDKLGEHQGAADDFIDGAQEQHLGGQDGQNRGNQ